MPKAIELTFELSVNKVSCPGVWLCQDGSVSLTLFTLGTSYQTCLLPPVFPLIFKDVFYFRKRFQESCNLNNICCMLKNETLYCELVQWCGHCTSDDCVVLAQYLGALADVLFPPNVCSNEGVDLLMRRSGEFPGILAPKIEITTKVRLDEVWSGSGNGNTKILEPSSIKTCSCLKGTEVDARQKQVCHTPMYHRIRCHKSRFMGQDSKSRSIDLKSLSTASIKDMSYMATMPQCPEAVTQFIPCLPKHRQNFSQNFSVYNVSNCDVDNAGLTYGSSEHSEDDVPRHSSCRSGVFPRRDPATDGNYMKGCRSAHQSERRNFKPEPDTLQRQIIESIYVQKDKRYDDTLSMAMKRNADFKVTPCTCNICKKYHDLFHRSQSKSTCTFDQDYLHFTR